MLIARATAIHRNGKYVVGVCAYKHHLTFSPWSSRVSEDREDTKLLLESILRDNLAGLRDRALISTMLFSLARISAVLSLKRQDFYYHGPRRWLRFHEKGGKEHEMPAHHQIEETGAGSSKPSKWPHVNRPAPLGCPVAPLEEVIFRLVERSDMT